MKTTKRKILLTLLALLLLLPNISLATPLELNLEYPKIAGFDLNIHQDLNDIIAWFYYFIVSIGGLAAFVMLVWAGFIWMTSTGNPAKITDAKDRIYSAFLGLLLILTSWLIIRIINPDLIILNLELP